MLTLRFLLAALSGLLSLAVLGATPAVNPEAAAGANLQPNAESVEPALTLYEALSRTREASPELAEFAFRLQAQEARIEGAGLGPAAELGAQFENLLGTGRTQGVDALEATFVLSQVVELGGARQRRIEAARGTLDQVALARQIAELEALAETTRRFIHVASDQKHLELTGLATRLAEETLVEVDRRVKAARSPDVERIRARIALSRARVDQEHAEHELLSSRRKLAANWGSRSDDFGPVSADLFELPQAIDAEALTRQLANSPDFLRFASEARQRDAEIRLAEAKARAPITLSAGVRRFEEGDDTAFVAGLSMPLFSGSRARPAVAEALALREAVDAAEATARVKAEASLFELVQELRHSLTEATMLKDEVLPQMDAALAATEYAWQRGRYSYLEWTEAQREHIAVQRALIEASANAHLFRVEIERLTGSSTTSDPAPDTRPDPSSVPGVSP